MQKISNTASLPPKQKNNKKRWRTCEADRSSSKRTQDLHSKRQPAVGDPQIQVTPIHIVDAVATHMEEATLCTEGTDNWQTLIQCEETNIQLKNVKEKYESLFVP